MNVTVFGATGAIGSLTVNELLRGGHTVTAYARNPRKVPTAWENRVRVVIGEMSDAAAIDQAVEGADVVISALGPSMDKNATGLPLVDGTGHILAAMNRHGVTPYIGHGTPRILGPHERPSPQNVLISFLGRTLLRRAYDELQGMTALIRDSGTDWTIVRFTAPKDAPKGERRRVGFYGTDRIGFPVSRADIAAFTAAQIDNPTYIRRAPAISN